MGKKKLANKLPSTTGDKRSDDRATVEARPPSPQPSQPAPTPPIPMMVPLDALAAFLMQQDPHRDWAVTLAGFGQTGGMPAIPTPTPEISAAISPLTTIPTSSTPTSSNRSPIHPQIEPLGVSPLSAHQQIEEEEEEEKESEEEGKEGEENENEKGRNEVEETLAENPITQENEREEIDLNETAKKQGLMTDEEFQSFLDGVNEMEIDADEMAEGLDLASQSVDEVKEKQTEEEKPKSVTPQSKAEGGDTETEEKEAEAQPEEPEPIVPSVSKPKAVKRRLILKNDPKAERQKPRRISQRCLGRWTSSKARANTAADAVEISSEDERTTPTKPGEESLTVTDLEDTPKATEMISPTLNDQEEETDEMAEGLDLASESVGHDVPIADNTMICVVAKPTAQK